MTGPTPKSVRPEFGEMQSSVTLLDFFHVWYGYRIWFVAGLLLVSVVAFGWNKFFLPKFYKAECRIYLDHKIPADQLVGFVDVQGSAGTRADQYQTLVQSLLAEQYLTSADLLQEVIARLQKPKPDEGQAWDLYELLGINDPDPQRRQELLLRALQNDLIKITQLQNSGLMSVSVELPNPLAAPRFVNTAIRVLQERFSDLDFGYYDKALQIYASQYKEEQVLSDKRARALQDYMAEHQFDHNEQNEQRRNVWRGELGTQSRWIVALHDKISKLSLATDKQARIAAQSVKVVDWARMPLKKSRPKTIINTIMATGLYTFVFMLGLAIISYIEWSRRMIRHPADE